MNPANRKCNPNPQYTAIPTHICGGGIYAQPIYLFAIHQVERTSHPHTYVCQAYGR